MGERTRTRRPGCEPLQQCARAAGDRTACSPQGGGPIGQLRQLPRLIRVEGIVESMGLLGNGVNIDIGGIGTSPEDFRPGGDGGCELEAVVGVPTSTSILLALVVLVVSHID